MLREMSSRTLSEWMVYYKLEPFGGELLDAHFARLNATQIDIWKKKGSKATDPKGFMLWKQVKKPFDPQRWYDGFKRLMFRK